MKCGEGYRLQKRGSMRVFGGATKQEKRMEIVGNELENSRGLEVSKDGMP